jgi:plasmid stability protein
MIAWTRKIRLRRRGGIASLLIRNVNDTLHDQLKLRAPRHHRFLEEEARELLRTATACDAAAGESLSVIAGRLFGSEQGIDPVLPPRAAELEYPPVFGEADG